jgi:cytochrome c oxidase subunit II
VQSIVLRVSVFAEEKSPPLVIKVIARQWWWEVRYFDPHGRQVAGTANELHIAAGRRVQFDLESRDVIHSFWVPNLHGKRDMIPGRVTSLWLQADTPGVYRGQCAEFCGLQHALMGFQVVVEPQEEFDRWLNWQAQPAQEPFSEAAVRGRDVFLSKPCMMCHTVRGTLAMAAVGPDLTHLASRQTLGAGIIPNTRGHLAGWIVNSQGIKPGNRTPPIALGSQELQDLLAYLETLR